MKSIAIISNLNCICVWVCQITDYIKLSRVEMSMGSIYSTSTVLSFWFYYS